MGWESVLCCCEGSLSWQCPRGTCGGPPGALRGPGGDDTAPAVPKVHQSLQETVRSFKVTNEELAARGTGGDQDVAACDTACKVRDSTTAGSSWGRISAPCWALLSPCCCWHVLGTDVLVPVQPQLLSRCLCPGWEPGLCRGLPGVRALR